MIKQLESRIAEVESKIQFLSAELNKIEEDSKMNKNEQEKLSKELKILLEAKKGLEDL